jgi:DNA-binding transcriptional regulator YdaS (Cro superfamily)
MKQYDEEDVLEYLRKTVAALGSQKNFAAKAEVSEQYLSDVLRGRLPVGSRILRALNFERVITYRRKAG